MSWVPPFPSGFRGRNDEFGGGNHDPGSESGTCFRTNRSCRLAPALRYENEVGPEVFGCGWCHPSPLDSGPVRGTAARFIAGMTIRGAGLTSELARAPCFSYQSLMPAGAGTPSRRSCGLVQMNWPGFCQPHSDPSGGQAPALHFLIPPSIIGLQFGRIRRWRAGIEVDWRAHPGSESGTCFRTNDDTGD